MIARVTLDLAVRKEFDYLVPEQFQGTVAVGSRVKVPFGPRQTMGVVTALVEESPHANLRPLLKVIGQQSLVTPRILELARWMATYYCSPLERVLKSVLPQAVRREQAGWKERLVVRALPQAGERPKLTARQEDIWKIIEEWREMPLQELVKVARTTPATIRKLEDLGLVSIAPKISERDPYGYEQILPTHPLPLNGEQTAAMHAIGMALERIQTPMKGRVKQGCEEATTFLLHGVTGSGKTEVYLQAIAHTLRQGKGAIVLVPEISLTPQTVERFKARFCHGELQTLVAVLHSHLSAGERHDEWHKIRQGRARIVVGARSALFSPVDPLGLIIVDEEHEPSYKQEESPRYHARDVAVVRGQKEGAVVILGTATPSMESFYNVRQGKYRLLNMPTRADDRKMPLIRVMDMRQEARKEKGIPIFSMKLREAILQRLERSEQTMLFLNRRGYASSFQCPKCAYVAECVNCSISLTYHRGEQKLACHICGYQIKAPRQCPACRNPEIRLAGIGTEKVEESLAKNFPKARVQRMDSDTLKRKEDYRRILGDFRTGKIDILLGTQMIAKGLHFPNVTLVGIIYADQSLHQPDFRAGERTFQLITQVAGRAGRGDVEGEVYVQAFSSFHPAIQYARRHDYDGFYDQEIGSRAQLKYPPVGRVALLTLKGKHEEKVKLAADYLKKEVEGALAGIKDLILAGPAPAPLRRAETFYRYQLMIRCRKMSKVSEVLGAHLRRLKFPEDIVLVVDIDPTSMG